MCFPLPPPPAPQKMLLVYGVLISLPFIWLNYLNRKLIPKGKKKEVTDQISGIKVFALFSFFQHVLR